MGEKARDLIRDPAFSGFVTAVLRTSAYLTGHEGEMLWIAGRGPPMHRRAVVCSLPLRGLVPGEVFSIQGSCIQIGERLLIQFDQAEEWAPPGVVPVEGVPLDALCRSVGRLLAALPARAGDGAFGGLFDVLRPAFHGEDVKDLPGGCPPAGPTAEPISDLIHACLRQDEEEVTRVGRELVGLGEGLSPSGDDFLGGLLFSVRSLQRAYPAEVSWEGKSIRDLLEWARSRTHPVSHTLLSDLAHGHGPEPLHTLLASLLRAEEERHLMREVARLTAIGHRSGWDMLAGFLTGMVAAAGRARDGRS